MALETYKVQAPNGEVITMEGPAGATDEVLFEQARQLMNAKPKSADRGNIINSDVPTVVGSRPNAVNPVAPQKPRGPIDYAAAAVEPIATMATGAIAQPVGAAYGLIKNAVSPEFGTQQGIKNAESEGARLAQALTYQPRSEVSKDVLGAVGEAADALKIPAYVPVIGEIPSIAKAASNAKQFASPYASRAANVLRKEIQEAPQTIPSVAKKVATEVGFDPDAPKAPKPPSMGDIKFSARRAPSLEDLAAESDILYGQARDAGISFKTKPFTEKMAEIGADLRAEGYTPTGYPKITGVLDELKNTSIPKDFVELQALRKIIAAAQGSSDQAERRLATKLKQDFDDFIINAPDNMVAAGSKEGLGYWKDARSAWSRLSKSEIFTDIIEKAQLDKSKYSMSGIENALTTQMRNLAKNDKKMRLFSPDEQEMIKQVAMGDNTDLALTLIGKVAPNSVVSSLPAIMLGGPAGVALGAAGFAAKNMAGKRKTGNIEALAAYMRKGKTEGGTPALDNKRLADKLTEEAIKKAKEE